MGPDRSANVEAPADDIVYCARHPQVETTLRCGRCDTPICPRCLVQTPVGARCRDCAGIRRIPTYNLTPLMMARALGAAVVSGVTIGAAWGYLLSGLGGFGFFSFIVGIGIGWAVAESISVATNRRMGPPLAACAVLAVVLCYFTRNLVLDDVLILRNDIGGYIAIGVAAFYAVSRLNR
ncbi:MAG: hypothetical protein AB7P33_02105 [Dehalococcoidia bacterium]